MGDPAGGDRSTVIVPCAGAGSRLELPYPKELLAVRPRRLLVDFTFDLLEAHADRVRVVVVVAPAKLATVRYLERYADRFELAFVYQRRGLPEVTGAVLSASSWFADRNVVLLPDQVLSPAAADPDPVGAAFAALEEAPFCFIAAPETDPRRLADDGALALASRDGTLETVAYADKPGAAASRFNAVWAGFGFRGDTGVDGVRLMHRSTCREPVSDADFDGSPLSRCPAIAVEKYVDVGTWARVAEFWAGASDEGR